MVMQLEMVFAFGAQKIVWLIDKEQSKDKLI
jgi:hypothetical protein